MKEIFILSRQEQLSYKEIPERMAISDQTVKKQASNVLNLSKFKANDKLSYDAAMKTNDFWSSYLYSNLYNSDNMHRLFERSRLRDRLTPAAVQETASKFISDKNVIKIIQLPETKK